LLTVVVGGFDIDAYFRQ